ncbi:hypothetical protein FV228_21470 [Methylobacterium sp. WL18]|uniref:hypothetical protein n=1 Tax=Methylobacterium sp. WL18 TaxID=2603897 RepID=UPI0011C733B5|nr:hypothetical protein [Methylobacterium sp. WL18]TXN61204.1 hypothetical protein FV228_21470 [Methylobacterium sp. WL18]
MAAMGGALTLPLIRSVIAAKVASPVPLRNQISAFVSVISGVPALLSVEAEDTASHVVLVPVAYCAVTDRLVQVESRLTDTQAVLWRRKLTRFHEFSFTILVVSLADDTPTYETQDRTYARPYLPDACRPFVMPIVAASLRALVAHVRPWLIYRVTKSRNPPEKALRKDLFLTRTLEDEGYAVVETGSDPWDRRFWILSRALTG